MQVLKKLFARSINCLYRELHCQPREAAEVNYRAEFQFGVKMALKWRTKRSNNNSNNNRNNNNI